MPINSSSAPKMMKLLPITLMLSYCLASECFIINSGMEMVTPLVAEAMFWSHIYTVLHTVFSVCSWSLHPMSYNKCISFM